MQTLPTGERLTVTEACAVLGCSPPTLYRYIRNHRDFPERDQFGRFLDLELLAWAAQHAIRAAKIVRS